MILLTILLCLCVHNFLLASVSPAVIPSGNLEAVSTANQIQILINSSNIQIRNALINGYQLNNISLNSSTLPYIYAINSSLFKALQTVDALSQIPCIKSNLPELFTELHPLIEDSVHTIHHIFEQIMKFYSIKGVDLNTVNTLNAQLMEWQQLLESLNAHRITNLLPTLQRILIKRASIDNFFELSYLADTEQKFKQLSASLENKKVTRKDLKQLIQLHVNYEMEVNFFQKKFPDYQSITMDKTIIQMRQALHSITGQALLKSLKNISCFLSELTFLDLQKQTCAMNYTTYFKSEELKKTLQDLPLNEQVIQDILSKIKPQSTQWISLVQSIQEMGELYYIAHEYLQTDDNTSKNPISCEYTQIAKNFEHILSHIQSIPTVSSKELSFLPKEYLTTLLVRPKMYGRVFGQYEKVCFILADLKLIELKLEKFKKTHSQLCQIIHDIEVVTNFHDKKNREPKKAAADSPITHEIQQDRSSRVTVAMSAVGGSPSLPVIAEKLNKPKNGVRKKK